MRWRQGSQRGKLDVRSPRYLFLNVSGRRCSPCWRPTSSSGASSCWKARGRWSRAPASLYRGFDHVEPALAPATAAGERIAAAPFLDPSSFASCGYELISVSGSFTGLFVTWTVPDLRFSPTPLGNVNRLHTFVGLGSGLGFLDVHVEMTVDSAEHVTSRLWSPEAGDINLAVRPGDVLSGALCLDLHGPAAAHYFLANETTAQTLNFKIPDTGFPPANTINAGVTRTVDLNGPPSGLPLASFGAVYFDEIAAYSVGGSRSLTSGTAITMVDQSGKTLARPVRLNDHAFKTVFVAA